MDAQSKPMNEEFKGVPNERLEDIAKREERRFLNIVLTKGDKELFRKAVEANVTKDWFYASELGEIWRLACKEYDEHGNIMTHYQYEELLRKRIKEPEKVTKWMEYFISICTSQTQKGEFESLLASMRDRFLQKLTWEVLNRHSTRILEATSDQGLVVDGFLADIEAVSAARRCVSSVGPKWKSLAKLDLEPRSETPWIVEELIPEGLTLIAAPDKAGKSALMMQVAAAVAEGQPALGRLKTKAGPVLYLALEHSDALNLRRMDRIFASRPKPDGLYLASASADWPTMDGDFLGSLRQAVEEIKPVMVVVDVWQCVAPTPPKNANAYEKDSKALAPLLQFAHEHHIALVLVHHTRKGKAEDPFEAVMGSRGMTSKPNQVLLLQRRHGESYGVLESKGRDSKGQKWALDFGLETGLWSYRGDAEYVETTGEKQQVLNVLNHHNGEWLTAREIVEVLAASGVNKTVASVRMTCNRLVQMGLVEDDGSGRGGRGNQKAYRSRGTGVSVEEAEDEMEPQTFDATDACMVEEGATEDSWLTR